MTQATGADVITQFLLHSPFVRHLGMRLESIEADRARLAMPYREELATIGDVVHGGALSALVDTTAMAASWSAHDTSHRYVARPSACRSTSSRRPAARRSPRTRA
jgi:acyl-coenzyme A thioesterase PaaI-like protein